MSTVPAGPKVQVAAHQSHWFDIFMTILRVVEQDNAILSSVNLIPAPIERGITIGIVSAATAGQVIQESQQVP